MTFTFECTYSHIFYIQVCFLLQFRYNFFMKFFELQKQMNEGLLKIGRNNL